jgi:hypothetical protein
VTILVIALMVPIAVLCMINLALTMAVIRRLRVHTDSLSTLHEQVGSADSGLPPGTAVPQLDASTDDGVHLGQGTLGSGEKVLAFVSSTCPACRLHLPDFVAAAGSAHGRDEVIVVVSGDRGLGDDLVTMAAPAAHVVVEPEPGRWTEAFDVRAFPTFFRLRDGLVEAVGASASDVVSPVRV